MKQIEITTSQFVTIRYNLGTVIDRILAFFIDLMIVSFAAALLTLITKSFQSPADESNILFFFTVYPWFLFYHLFMEAFGGGRSFGKKILKLKPVKKNGAEMSFLDYFMRWIFRLPDILLSLGTLAVIMISSSSASQRLGDLLADTVLVKTENSSKFGLHWILKMNKQQESYQPTYPQVRQLSENDILLIKEVVDRYSTHPTNASKEALAKMAQLLEKELGIKGPANKQNFLKTAIKDYVFVTR